MTDVFTSTATAKRITGLAGTGKTELLIKDIKTLVDQGILPNDIRVFCATDSAVCAFKTRLEHAIGQTASSIPITTAMDFSLEILGTEEAISYTSRKPRLLTQFEYNFLLEDLKVGGLRPKRLREILKFFYRSWTEFDDDDPDWLITGEETETHTLLKDTLTFFQAYLEPEVSSFAVHYLNSHEAALEAVQRSFIFVDDYQCLNRASQALVNTIASESITIAGHETECIEVEDPYPYVLGLTEFTQINPHAEEVSLQESFLSEAVTTAANQLLSDSSMGEVPLPTLSSQSAKGSLVTHEYASIEDEFKGIAVQAAQAIAEGLKPSEIFIIVPNNPWRKKISDACKHQGITVDSVPDKQVLGGDIRDYSACTNLRIATALKLVADPENAIAWRSWCGYGDYLANSAIFNAMREYADQENLSLIETLKKLDENPDLLPGSQKVVGAFRAGKLLIEKVKDLTGSALLDGLSALVSAGTLKESPLVIKQLCEPLEALDQAEVMASRLMKNLLFPQFSGSDSAIKIGSAKQLRGLSPKMLIYSGFVNGFIPDRDYFDSTITPLDKQERIHASDTRLLYTAIGTSKQDLVFSYFTKTDLESAEILKLEIDRIRIEKGKRVCMIAPSEFLATLQE